MSCVDGDTIVGGDGFSDRKRTGIVSAVLFCPMPLYIHTGVWPELRHTKNNTFNFFAEQIVNPGQRNIFGFVSDTKPRMQGVWWQLQERFPWMVVVPCAAYCFDLLFGDISKHLYLTKDTIFCTTLSQFWRNKFMPNAILERLQKDEYGSVRQMQRTGVTSWKSELLVADALLKTQTTIQKSVVYDRFRKIVLKDKNKTVREAAAEVVDLVKNDGMWARLKIYVDLLRPVALALDAGHGNNLGVGSFCASFCSL